ncbi:flippase-like domain-containing protein [Streptomyces sp. 8K308]|uniref:lysylphosphatidylglycerol synthase transmembrane domain-containing protein n=1 Tax=Streptomyces sp. 8K308 TaxID=2530388 RepID=UPI001050F87B|nr:YbhN family protein [Streptomyces sp. 8K308]TDC11203.1 flippase-like domain-containing protein [Streptomyces sp. 8K308]
MGVEGSRTPGRAGRAWWPIAVLLVGGAVFVAISRREELGKAFELLARVSLVKLPVALVCETGALLCLSAVQRWLLLAGGFRTRLTSMFGLVLAANAVAGALPGGAAFSTAWLYRQLRRRGVGQALAAASLVVSGALSALGLLVIIVIGLLTTGARGPGAVIGRVLAVLALLTIVLLAIFRSARVRAACGRGWQRLKARYDRVRRGEEAVRGLVEQARSVQPGLRPWLRPYALAQFNWVLDAACLAASLWALDIGVPWHGVLIAYALAQIPGSLRLTPGGVGIVEASLTALLVVYGLSPQQALAGTLLYRFWSYWLLQPVGWGCWVAFTLHGRRSDDDADSDAGLGPDPGSDSRPDPRE